MSDVYSKLGASTSKAEVHRAIAQAGAGLLPGAFCKVMPDLSGDPDYVSILHADGAGTKSAVAYLRYKETGEANVFRGIAQDAAVMNLDDLACVGAVDRFLLSNTIGRNAHRVGGDAIEALVAGYEAVAARLGGLGIDVVTAGGETADVGDLVQTVIADSTIYARVRRDALVDASRIAPGQVIVGLSSTGQATYEDTINSGIGANGLTAARHILLHRDYATRYPETVSATVDPALVYRGRFHLDTPLPGAEMSAGAALLSPTRTYLPIVRDVLAGHRAAVSGLVHCSGGGQTKCLAFGRDLQVVKTNLAPVPALFRQIQAEGDVDVREMFQMFNMGHRLEVYCEAHAADAVIACAAVHGVEARVVGEVRRAATPGRNELTIVDGDQELTFHRPLAPQPAGS